MQYELPCVQHLCLIFVVALFYICAHMFSVGFGISRVSISTTWAFTAITLASSWEALLHSYGLLRTQKPF